MSKRKSYIWVGRIPSIWGYGSMVLGKSEEEVMKALKKDFYECRKLHKNGLPDHFSTFKKALEYFGGGAEKVELGKIYFDDFGY